MTTPLDLVIRSGLRSTRPPRCKIKLDETNGAQRTSRAQNSELASPASARTQNHLHDAINDKSDPERDRQDTLPDIGRGDEADAVFRLPGKG